MIHDECVKIFGRVMEEMLKKAELDEQVKRFALSEEPKYELSKNMVSRGMSAQNRKIYNLVAEFLYCECLLVKR